jgi:hypothetical protein
MFLSPQIIAQIIVLFSKMSKGTTDFFSEIPVIASLWRPELLESVEWGAVELENILISRGTGKNTPAIRLSDPVK